jgi:hypothetical protein
MKSKKRLALLPPELQPAEEFYRELAKLLLAAVLRDVERQPSPNPHREGDSDEQT